MKDDGEIDRTRVGHTKADETDVYAGRGPGGRDMNQTGPGTRGWLGNPYPLDDARSRAASIEAFRADFVAKLKSDDEFRAAVRNLAGETLGCWCQRLDADEPACHAEVIAEWADKLARQEGSEPVTDGGQPADESDHGTHVNQNKLTVWVPDFECRYCAETRMCRLSYEDSEWVHYTCGMPVDDDAAAEADERLANGEGKTKYPEAEAKQVASGLSGAMSEVDDAE